MTMWQYWLLFLLPAFRALSNQKPLLVSASFAQDAQWRGWWCVMFGILVVMIGLRHEVGADWGNYLTIFNSKSGVSLKTALSQGDPAYSLLNWAAAELGLGVHWVNVVCAALFAWGLLAFCRAQPRRWLALVVAVPYLVTVVGMGLTRQGVAIGLAMLGLVALSRGKVFYFVLWLVFAALFHKSAVILVPLAMLAGNKKKIFTVLWVATAAALLFILMLQESIQGLKEVYTDVQLDSSGAGIRVTMNALPAALFLVLRKRFQLETAERAFWTWMAWGGLAFIVLLKISPSSTAVDRVALYWIPLQLFIWARVPEALGRRGADNTVWVYGIVLYSASVLLVWLLFSEWSKAWLPYQFYPWQLLWN